MSDLLAAAIRSELRQAGMIDDAAEVYADQLRAAIAIDGDAIRFSKPVFGIAPISLSGEDMSIGDMVATVKTLKPGLFAAAEAPADTTITARMIATRQAEKAEASSGNRGAEIAAKGNPYSKAHWNMTFQSLLRRADPAMADRLQAEASK